MVKKINLIVGTRPNFIKALPVYLKLKSYFNLKIIHTGQHYSKSLDIYETIDLPIDINLGINESDRSNLIVGIENELKKDKPDLVIVFGDVNSSYAGAIAAKKLGIKIAHIEAGLRSNFWVMDEEINRYLIDAISDYLFVTEEVGLNNLKDEFNLTKKKVFLVGTVMLDTLHIFKDTILVKENTEDYGVATFHRKENIENKNMLEKIKDLFTIPNLKVYAHPNLEKRINIIAEKPLPYKEFLKILYNSNYVITDSGGIQEEAAFMSIPCITYRAMTEKPITLNFGNIVTQDNNEIKKLIKTFKKSGQINKKVVSTLWGDGKASERICNELRNIMYD